LRISAVIHDNEIKLDDYTKVYYDSIKADEKQRADLKSRKIIKERQEDPNLHPSYKDLNEHEVRKKTMHEDVKDYIQYDKILGNLRKKFVAYQEEIFKLIGYNFEFLTPLEVIETFKSNFWQKNLKIKIYKSSHM